MIAAVALQDDRALQLREGQNELIRTQESFQKLALQQHHERQQHQPPSHKTLLPEKAPQVQETKKVPQINRRMALQRTPSSRLALERACEPNANRRHLPRSSSSRLILQSSTTLRKRKPPLLGGRSLSSRRLDNQSKLCRQPSIRECISKKSVRFAEDEGGNVVTRVKTFKVKELSDRRFNRVFWSKEQLGKIGRRCRKTAVIAATDCPSLVKTIEFLYETDAGDDSSRWGGRTSGGAISSDSNSSNSSASSNSAKKGKNYLLSCSFHGEGESTQDEVKAIRTVVEPDELRGLESRIYCTIRIRRRNMIQDIVTLQDKLKSSDAPIGPDMIAVMLGKRSAHLSKRARAFAAKLARGDAIEAKKVFSSIACYDSGLDSLNDEDDDDDDEGFDDVDDFYTDDCDDDDDDEFAVG